MPLPRGTELEEIRARRGVISSRWGAAGDDGARGAPRRVDLPRRLRRRSSSTRVQDEGRAPAAPPASWRGPSRASSCWRAASRGRPPRCGRVVLVAGEPGIGSPAWSRRWRGRLPPRASGGVGPLLRGRGSAGVLALGPGGAPAADEVPPGALGGLLERVRLGGSARRRSPASSPPSSAPERPSDWSGRCMTVRVRAVRRCRRLHPDVRWNVTSRVGRHLERRPHEVRRIRRRAWTGEDQDGGRRESGVRSAGLTQGVTRPSTGDEEGPGWLAELWLQPRNLL